MNSVFTENIVAFFEPRGLIFQFVDKASVLKACAQVEVSPKAVNTDGAINSTALVTKADTAGIAAQFINALNDFKNLRIVFTEGLIFYEDGFHVLGFLALDSSKAAYAMKYMAKQAKL